MPVEIPAKHRHRFGGCEGVLRISSELLIFDTEKAEDRRMWRLRDLQSFGTAGPYSLRLSTELETFNFDLKTPLTQEIQDFLWQRLRDEHPYEKGTPMIWQRLHGSHIFFVAFWGFPAGTGIWRRQGDAVR